MCRAVSSYARIPLNEETQKSARPAATAAEERRASRGRGRRESHGVFVAGVVVVVVAVVGAAAAPEPELGGWREESMFFCV